MDIKEVLSRIDKRLEELQISSEAASQRSGLSRDAIRNLRRRSEVNKPGGAQMRTLDMLTVGLETTLVWLLTGIGDHDDETEQLIRAWDRMSPANRVRLLQVAKVFASVRKEDDAHSSLETDADPVKES